MANSSNGSDGNGRGEFRGQIEYDYDLNAAIKAPEADGKLRDEIGGRLSANLQ